MEYSAGNVSNLLWFVEMRETVKLILDNDTETVNRKVIEENLYQQKSEKGQNVNLIVSKGELTHYRIA